jgi:RNA polymerase sigma-70 factor (ECF subfamily)
LARAWLFQIMRRAAFRQAVPSMQSLDDEEQPEQTALVFLPR